MYPTWRQVQFIAVCAIVLFVTQVLTSFLRRRSISPHRPFLACFLDSATEIFYKLRIGPWKNDNDIKASMAIAEKNTGLSDYGTTTNFDFVKRYELARNAGMEISKAKYSPMGFYLIGGSLVRRMEARLKSVEFFKRHPAVAKTKLRPPIFVIGFPRTGTTFLHELLGLHNDVRMHYTWEQFEPVPSTNDESIQALEADRRKKYIRNKTFFDYVFHPIAGDAIQQIHRIGYDEPEECTVPCSSELPWTITEIPLMIYAIKQLIPMGAGDAYVHYKQFLQLMTWQSEDRREKDFTWMLKCPFHLPYLRELHETFPDSTVVWTHRDPAECIASACSLYETILRMGCEEPSIDRNSLGAAVMNYTKVCLVEAEKAFVALGDKFKVVHVRYADTVKSSKQVCVDIYKKSGIECGSSYTEKVDAYLSHSAEQRKKLKAKGGGQLHAYKPEDYGLTVEGIHQEFAAYIKKYNLLEK